MTVSINNARADVDKYFSSVVLAWKKLKQTPLLMFREVENGISVTVIEQPGDIAFMEDDTLFMGQWRGEWSSDYFYFSAKQLKDFVRANPDSVRYKDSWIVILETV